MNVGYLLYDSDGALDHSGLVDRFGLSATEVLKLSGGNLGNHVFKYAARKLIQNSVVNITYHDDVELLKQKIDFLVLPEANIVNPMINYGVPAKFIQEINKPCLLLGVGAQMPKGVDDSYELTIPEGTVNFLKQVAKRTSSILVRGKITERVIKNLGIENVEAIGCPSYMINPSKDLWGHIQSKLNRIDLFRNIVCTEGVYPQKVRSLAIDQTEKFLFSLVAKGLADYIAQVQTSVINYGLGSYDKIDRNDMFYLRNYLLKETIQSTFEEIAKKHFKAFARVDEWLQYLTNRNVTVGTRIHGNILSLQALTPSLPIVHDSRTQELCEIMGLPHVDADDFAAVNSVDDLCQAFDVVRNLNATALDEHRLHLARRYYSCLLQHDLKPSDHLVSLARQQN